MVLCVRVVWFSLHVTSFLSGAQWNNLKYNQKVEIHSKYFWPQEIYGRLHFSHLYTLCIENVQQQPKQVSILSLRARCWSNRMRPNVYSSTVIISLCIRSNALYDLVFNFRKVKCYFSTVRALCSSMILLLLLFLVCGICIESSAICCCLPNKKTFRYRMFVWHMLNFAKKRSLLRKTFRVFYWSDYDNKRQHKRLCIHSVPMCKCWWWSIRFGIYFIVWKQIWSVAKSYSISYKQHYDDDIALCSQSIGADRRKKAGLSFDSTFACGESNSIQRSRAATVNISLLYCFRFIQYYIADVSSWGHRNNCVIHAHHSINDYSEWQWHVWMQISEPASKQTYKFDIQHSLVVHRFKCPPKISATNCIRIRYSIWKDKGNVHLKQFNDFTIWEYSTQMHSSMHIPLASVCWVCVCVCLEHGACVIWCLMAQLKVWLLVTIPFYSFITVNFRFETVETHTHRRTHAHQKTTKLLHSSNNKLK